MSSITLTPEFFDVVKQRFLNLIRAAEESSKDAPLNLKKYFHDSGAPSCLLARYAMRPDLQDFLNPAPAAQLRRRGEPDSMVLVGSPEILEHFHIDFDDAYALFGGEGCSDAVEVWQAVIMIRDFFVMKFGRTLE